MELLTTIIRTTNRSPAHCLEEIIIPFPLERELSSARNTSCSFVDGRSPGIGCCNTVNISRASLLEHYIMTLSACTTSCVCANGVKDSDAISNIHIPNETYFFCSSYKIIIVILNKISCGLNNKYQNFCSIDQSGPLR